MDYIPSHVSAQAKPFSLSHPSSELTLTFRFWRIRFSPNLKRAAKGLRGNISVDSDHQRQKKK